MRPLPTSATGMRMRQPCCGLDPCTSTLDKTRLSAGSSLGATVKSSHVLLLSVRDDLHVMENMMTLAREHCRWRMDTPDLSPLPKYHVSPSPQSGSLFTFELLTQAWFQNRVLHTETTKSWSRQRQSTIPWTRSPARGKSLPCWLSSPSCRPRPSRCGFSPDGACCTHLALMMLS